MATLIKVWVDSSLVSKCDGDCYNATDSDCDCCCGGVNHGVGLLQATQNTRSISLGSIIDWIEAHAEFKQSVTIIITPRHLQDHSGTARRNACRDWVSPR